MKRMMISSLLWATVAISALSGSAYAGVSLLNDRLFNTGVDANNDGIDDNYTVSWDAGGPNAYVVTGVSPSFFPAAWLANSSDSRWLSVTSTNTQQAPASYTYETTFDLTGFILASIDIQGRWIADDFGTNILLNGTSIATYSGTALNAFNSFFTLPTMLLNQSTNTLAFNVVNNINPSTGSNSRTGFRAEFTTATGVPAPVPLVLFGAGMIGFVLTRRKEA